MESSKMTNLLTPPQSSFLSEFFQLTQNFYLTGGTALSAFYLQHRYSEDLDLFTASELFFQSAEGFVGRACTKLGWENHPVLITTFFKHFKVGSPESPLTLHFSSEVPFRVKPPNRFGEILVDSIEDITVNKICAALGRTEIKDLVDLYFLDKAGYTIADYFALARQKDGGLAHETLAYTLSQFEITQIPSFMLAPLTVEELQHYLEATIRWLIEQSAPPVS